MGAHDLAATTPVGVRDYTPEHADAFYAFEGRIVRVFAAHGYRRVMTPAFELARVFELGLDAAGSPRLLRFVDPQTGEVLALRSDMTPQIARMVAGPLAAHPLPLRLSYFGRVFRVREQQDFERREVAQAGVELIGPSDVQADVELLRVCDEALLAAGTEGRHCISLGHSGLVQRAIEATGLDDVQRTTLLRSLARKDKAGVASLGGTASAVVEALCGLHGPPDAVIARVRPLLGDHSDLAPGVARLEAVLAALPDDVRSRCLLDLGELLGFGYYTGVVFQAWVPGVGRPVASGGRYDRLIARYGRDVPAAGFAIDEEALRGD